MDLLYKTGLFQRSLITWDLSKKNPLTYLSNKAFLNNKASDLISW